MLAARCSLTLGLLALFHFSASPAAVADELDCGQNSGAWISFPAQCYTAFGFSSGSDACRASRQGLKDQLVGAAGGYTCADSDCPPESCNTKIECDTEDCSQVVTGQPYISQTTGLYNCATCWTGGQGRVYCSACDHI